jgi:hypothetical protein
MRYRIHMHINVLSESLKDKENCGNMDTDGRRILRWAYIN